MWGHVKHVNPLKEHPERITKKDKKITERLNYDGIDFPVRENDSIKIEKMNNICINVFGYEGRLLFPIYVSKQKFEDLMDLLLVRDGYKSHYVYIKDFSRFMFHKTKSKNKKWFCKSCLQRFSSKNVLTDHKENVLCINGAQSVKLEKGTIKFENYCREIRCPFKIYCDFEWNLEGLKFMKALTQKETIVIFLAVLLTKLFELIIDLVSGLLVLYVKMLLMNLSKQFLKSMNTIKK